MKFCSSISISLDQSKVKLGLKKEKIMQEFINHQMNKVALNDDAKIIVKSGFHRPKVFGNFFTQIDLKSSSLITEEDQSRQRFSSLIELKGSVNKDLHFQLQRKELSGKRNLYLIRSLCEFPFLINGTMSFKAIMGLGDTIDLFSTEITINSGQTEMKSHKEKLPSSSITSDLPILITGETGTGKTSLAYDIHKSSRYPHNFVHLNLNSFNPNLFESEVFGHVKGAFSGAIHDKKGALREANHGTLFLDEIDSLSYEQQTKLLIFLDNSKVRPVGSQVDYKVNCRMIFSSGRPLDELVKSGKMRKDFYYRLKSGICHELVPLRECVEKIESQIKNFEKNNQVIFDRNLIDFYKTLPWSGNYRELNGHLKKKLVLSQKTYISFCDEDNQFISQSSSLDKLKIPENCLKLDDLISWYAKKTYYDCHSNLIKTSKILNISKNRCKRILNTHLGFET